ncbi:MAG: tryptophan--tRNA ligase [Candidatus Paceibacterota bacterium]|jgi:tryptophanyl-tRNA synthetase
MADKKKILLSGIKPTGNLHLGNYFGAIKQFVELQNKYDSYVFIADYHAMTTLLDAKELSENSFNIAVDYMALGLDPTKMTLFKQSDLPQVTELCWIFNCLTTVPYLERAHAYKDAVAKGKEANIGLFDYPILMAADILIQDADIVPVGQDQKQHVEYARDTAEKFNRTFGKAFKIPEPYILKDVAVVPGIDGQKMSKSYNNTIPIFASDEEIKKLVMGIVTDSNSGRPENVYAIHKLIKPEAELEKVYTEFAGKYQKLKEALYNDLVSFLTPFREKREQLLKDRAGVLAILKAGGDKARARAEAKMAEVRKLTGLTLTA